MTVIRPLELSDAPALTELVVASREHLEPWEPARPERFYTLGGQQELLRLALSERRGGRMGPYVVLDEQGSPAGRITLNNVVRGAGQYASVGYWLGVGQTGRGLATRALAELVDLAFGEWGLHRLEAGTLLHNTASQRVLERNGFQPYGLARKYVMIAGTYQDHQLYELLSPDLR